MKDHPSQRTRIGLTCRDVAEWATAYLEDRLPIFSRVCVGVHVASCADCREYVKQIAEVCETVKGLPNLYPAPVNRHRLCRQFVAHHGQSVHGI
jgi:predicted anti-sigma-YlaC factor YlaD